MLTVLALCRSLCTFVAEQEHHHVTSLSNQRYRPLPIVRLLCYKPTGRLLWVLGTSPPRVHRHDRCTVVPPSTQSLTFSSPKALVPLSTQSKPKLSPPPPPPQKNTHTHTHTHTHTTSHTHHGIHGAKQRRTEVADRELSVDWNRSNCADTATCPWVPRWSP